MLTFTGAVGSTLRMRRDCCSSNRNKTKIPKCCLANIYTVGLFGGRKNVIRTGKDLSGLGPSRDNFRNVEGHSRSIYSSFHILSGSRLCAFMCLSVRCLVDGTGRCI